MGSFKRALHAGLTGDHQFAYVQFLKPSVRFLDWMEQTYTSPRKHITDVGAGVGHVAAALRLRGLDAKAIDLNRREREEHPVEIVNAMTYPFPTGSVALFCRPCHGDFVECAIEAALDCDVSEVLYVGLPRNRAADLGRFNKHFRLALRLAGDDREHVYRMTDYQERP